MIYFLMRELNEMSEVFAMLNESYMSSVEVLLTLIFSIVFTLASFAVYYTFRSIGLYKMAKNKGMIKPIRAIIPFFSIKVINELTPNGKYVKRNDIFYVLAMVFGGVSAGLYLVIDVFFGIPALLRFLETGRLAQAISFNEYLINGLVAVHSLSTLAYSVFMIILFSGVFKSYDVKHGGTYTMLTVLVYAVSESLLLGAIFIFILRNKSMIDYDAFIEDRRRSVRNPYNANPYDRNSYGKNTQSENPYNGTNTAREDDINPFEEFDGTSKKTTDTSSADTFSSGSVSDDDDLFN